MQSDVVVITGGTGAIGKSLCQRFLRDGYAVVANCHPDDLARSELVIKQLSHTKSHIVLMPFDVTDAESCQRSIDDIESRVGAISVAVNAAGITRDATLKKLHPEQWHTVINTNPE